MERARVTDTVNVEIGVEHLIRSSPRLGAESRFVNHRVTAT